MFSFTVKRPTRRVGDKLIGDADYRGGVYGQVIPVSTGKRVLTGVPLWCGQFRWKDQPVSRFLPTAGSERAFPRDAIVDFAVGFGHCLAPADERASVGIAQLWADGVLVYDATDVTVAKKYPDVSFSVHSGTAAQLPDPTIVADKGDVTPGFRDMVYAVFKDFPVSQWAIPVIRAEVVDNLTLEPTSEQFSVIADGIFTDVQGPWFIDWEQGRLWGFSDTNSPTGATLHEFDLNALEEVKRTAVTGYTDNINPTDLLLYDRDNRIVITQQESIFNTTPICAIDVDTAQVRAVFGEASNDTTSDSDGLAYATRGTIVRCIENGVEYRAAVLGGWFEEALSVLQFNGPVGSFSGFDYVETVQIPDCNCAMFYPTFDGPKNVINVHRNSTQDAHIFVGAGNALKRYCLGAFGGRIKFTGEVATVATFGSYHVINMFMDWRDGGLVCILEDPDTTLNRAAKFRIEVAGDGFLPTG